MLRDFISLWSRSIFFESEKFCLVEFCSCDYNRKVCTTNFEKNVVFDTKSNFAV